MPPPDPATLIDPLAAPAGADEQLIAAWEAARGFLAARRGFRSSALHRALRPDVDFRFVVVAQVDSPQAWEEAVSDPAFPGLPVESRASLYEVARRDGTPDVEGGVVLINPFEVPDTAEERFLVGWERARDALAQQQGYLGTRLHRSLGAAEFRFVNIARWSSPLMFARALKRPEFERAAQALPFPSHPALYQIVSA